MGILSDIGDAITGVFKGILKVFKPILEPLAKLLDSSFGKALMIGLSIFTLGGAMMAGYGAFSAGMTAGNGFMASFVEGGKVFLSTLTGIGGKEGAGAGADAVSTAEGAVASTGAAGDVTAISLHGGGTAELAGQGGLAAEAGGALAEGAAGGMAMGPGATGDVMQRSVTAGGGAATGQGAMLPPGAGDAAKVAELTKASTGAITAGGKEGGNWLTKAAKAAGDFAKTEGGGQVVGSLIQGVGNYYTQKDQQEFDDRVRRDWMDPNSKGVANVRAQSGRVGRLQTPNAQDIARVSRGTAQEDQGRPTFNRAYGAAAGG